MRVGADIESGISALRGGGQPLPESIRKFFEPRFGHDFSQVRLHNDSYATELANELNARAFTVGRNMVFGAGQYAPETNSGRQLIAHELTHVLQQIVDIAPSSRTWRPLACARRSMIQREISRAGRREATIQVRWTDDDVEFYHRVIAAIAASRSFHGLRTASLWQPFHDPIFRFFVRYSSRLTQLRAGDLITLRVSAWFDPTVFHGQVTSASVEAAEEASLREDRARTGGATPSPTPPRAASPATFPPRGMRVIGSDAGALRDILTTCTGLNLRLGADNLLTVAPGAGRAQSSSARTQLQRLLQATPVGIIVDTNPAAEAVEVGAFSRAQPGYQQIDVANVRALAAGTGVRAGLSACDAVMHEITEAFAGRQASITTSAAGDELFRISHSMGERIEARIRADLRLPPRATAEQGNTILLGRENPTTLIFLSSMIFVRDAERFTQLSVVRFVLGPVRAAPGGGTQQSGDYNVVASHVVSGVERFSNAREAILVFNRFARNFGFRPLPVPSP